MGNGTLGVQYASCESKCENWTRPQFTPHPTWHRRQRCNPMTMEVENKNSAARPVHMTAKTMRGTGTATGTVGGGVGTGTAMATHTRTSSANSPMTVGNTLTQTHAQNIQQFDRTMTHYHTIVTALIRAVGSVQMNFLQDLTMNSQTQLQNPNDNDMHTSDNVTNNKDSLRDTIVLELKSSHASPATIHFNSAADFELLTSPYLISLKPLHRSIHFSIEKSKTLYISLNKLIEKQANELQSWKYEIQYYKSKISNLNDRSFIKHAPIELLPLDVFFNNQIEKVKHVNQTSIEQNTEQMEVETSDPDSNRNNNDPNNSTDITDLDGLEGADSERQQIAKRIKEESAIETPSKLSLLLLLQQQNDHELHKKRLIHEKEIRESKQQQIEQLKQLKQKLQVQVAERTKQIDEYITHLQKISQMVQSCSNSMLS